MYELNQAADERGIREKNTGFAPAKGPKGRNGKLDAGWIRNQLKWSMRGCQGKKGPISSSR